MQDMQDETTHSIICKHNIHNIIHTAMNIDVLYKNNFKRTHTNYNTHAHVIKYCIKMYIHTHNIYFQYYIIRIVIVLPSNHKYVFRLYNLNQF